MNPDNLIEQTHQKSNHRTAQIGRSSRAGKACGRQRAPASSNEEVLDTIAAPS